jgi:hypothetical protein
MQTVTTPHPAIHALARIDEFLELAKIRFKLANPEDGVPPSKAVLDEMEAEYRKFLALRLAHPDDEIVPCKLVDEMWHRHILDTRAYAEDCQHLFGAFMHHFPYFGMRGPDDKQALHDAYDLTLERYRDAFGEPPADTWISPDARRRCRTQCRPMRCR